MDEMRSIPDPRPRPTAPSRLRTILTDSSSYILLYGDNRFGQLTINRVFFSCAECGTCTYISPGICDRVCVCDTINTLFFWSDRLRNQPLVFLKHL